MANKFATNYLIGSTFEVVWKTTRVMKSAGWTTVASSNGLTKVAPATDATDSWGTNADPLADTYPVNFTTNAQWIVMRGPSTFKIPITASPGNMLRGEKIIQAASGAIGELIGIVFDNGNGYAVVAPRTGTFNNTNVITGSSSGLSISPNGTIVEFTREVMFYRAAGTALLQAHYICADVVAENAQLFSTLATSAGCTAVVPPSCGGTGNGYPALAMCFRGTPGTTTGSAMFNNSTSGNAQIGCASATGTANESADGSFYAAYNTASGTSMEGFIFSKLDNTEPGDLDPYIFIFSTSQSPTTWTRVSAAPAIGSNILSPQMLNNTTNTTAVGYQARGSGQAPKDIVSTYFATTLSVSNLPAASYYYPSSSIVLTSLSPNPTYLRIPIWIMSNKQTTTPNYPQLKGSLKWLYLSSVGNKFDLFDNRKTICVSSFSNSSTPPLFIGLYDGISVPLA